MFYIVGLGNPGEKYERTRHNVGRMCVEYINEDGSFTDWNKSKHANAFYSHGDIEGSHTELILPETFMNKSGDTLRYIMKKHDAKPEDFVVLHDDIDLPFGEIKISKSRGAGGNNGISSIINTLNTKDFVRIRIGIAPTSFWSGEMKRPAGGGPLERFVLKPFSRKEEKQLGEIKKRVYDALRLTVKDGPEKAMNQYN